MKKAYWEDLSFSSAFKLYAIIIRSYAEDWRMLAFAKVCLGVCIDLAKDKEELEFAIGLIPHRCSFLLRLANDKKEEIANEK